MFKHHQYKGKPFGFGSTDEGRLIRAEKQEVTRREQRDKRLTTIRHLPKIIPSPEIVQPAQIDDNMSRLLKWKAEKDRRKKLEQVKKKPVFKVGIVHHKLYSPIATEEVPHRHTANQMKNAPSPPKRITRATAKRLEAKLAQPKAVSNVSRNKKTQSNKKQADVARKEEVKQDIPSFAPANYQFKGLANLQNLPMFGRVLMANTPAKSRKSFGTIFTSTKRLKDDETELSNKSVCIENEKATASESDTNKDSGDDTESCSIETVNLRLSSDDQETFDMIQKSGEPNTEEESQKESIKSNTSVDESSDVNKSISVLNKTPPATDPVEPAFLSPYIVTSRGKSSARKEQQRRRGFGVSPKDDIPTKDTVMLNLNVSVEEEERTARYFKFLLDKEVNRLNELCEKWIELKSSSDVTEDAQHLINQAVGQTTLLMSKKFQRFRGLVLDCETGKGEMLVTCKDLQGFWDLMYMEVRNCESRFEQLEKLRANNWQDEEYVPVKPAVKTKGAIKKKPSARSTIKSFILASRRTMKQTGRHPSENTEKEGDAIKESTLAESDENIVAIKSPSVKRASTRLSINKSSSAKKERTMMSLLQEVRLTQMRKEIRSPLAIMKISTMCKTPEVQFDNTITYYNSDQTPGKSILKRTDKCTDNECPSAKSMCKVDFDDRVVLNEVPVDEETMVKKDLSAALARIDSFDFDYRDPEVAISAEKRLNFDDTSFEEEVFSSTHSDTNVNDNLSTDKILTSSKIVQKSPLRESLNIVLKTSKRRSTAREAEERNESDVHTRVLRNRTVTVQDSPRLNRSVKTASSEDDGDQNENKTPSKTRRSLRKTTSKETEQIRKESMGRRSSTRRSVRIVVEERTKSKEGEFLHPATPHTKRNRSSSRSSNRKSTEQKLPHFAEGDLISWETPRKT